MVDATLLQPIITMNRAGLFHFDRICAPPDRRRAGTRHRLGARDRARFRPRRGGTAVSRRHLLHDTAYTVTQFINCLVAELTGIREPAPRNAYIVDYTSGRRPPGLPAEADAVIRRYGPVAEVINAFYWRLFTEARDIPFSSDIIQRAALPASLPR